MVSRPSPNEQQNAVGRGQHHEQGIPRRMPQNARPCHAKRCRGHFSPLTTKLEVATGPFHPPSTARTRQVHFSPAFSFIFGVHLVSLSPASRVASSLPPDVASNSKTY